MATGDTLDKCSVEMRDAIAFHIKGLHEADLPVPSADKSGANGRSRRLINPSGSSSGLGRRCFSSYVSFDVLPSTSDQRSPEDQPESSAEIMRAALAPPPSLARWVPSAVAGAAPTGFSLALLRLYLRTHAMRQQGSLRPRSRASRRPRMSG